jgi:hypothetical protein
MTSKWGIAMLVTLLIAAATALTVSTARAEASAKPVVTGCPAAYSLFTVGTPPYKLPGELDDPANGGNADGYVCALAHPNAVRDAFCARGLLGACLLQRLGLPLNEFMEDDNPARTAERR